MTSRKHYGKEYLIFFNSMPGQPGTTYHNMVKTIYVVGIISDQVQNNHAAWVIGGKDFEDYDEACEYASELNVGAGESVYFQEEEQE